MAQAQTGAVFKCVDKAGKVSYQHVECAGSAALAKTIDARPAPPEAEARAQPATPSASNPSRFVKSPKSPTIGFHYNPWREPVGFSTGQIEASIQRAIRLWNSQCNVNLEYQGVRRGEVALNEQNAMQGYTIRWSAELSKVSNHGLGTAARGGSRFGVEMNPDGVRNGTDLDRVIVHEIGHVIGIGHLHDDPHSVMSYRGRSTTPNASDYYSCNLAMQQRYGIEFELPANASTSKTTDAEVASELLAKRRQR